jgi:Ca2+/Na+ antiporter
LGYNEIPNYYIGISIVGTIFGFVWMFICCNLMIDLLNVFVIIFKLDETYMGLTILGIGTALPDALTTIALSK